MGESPLLVGRCRGHVASNPAGLTEPRAAPSSLSASEEVGTRVLKPQGTGSCQQPEQDLGKDPEFQKRTKPADILIPSLSEPEETTQTCRAQMSDLWSV